MIFAAGGSLLTLLAFFAMPLISFGPFSVTSAGAAAAPDSLGGDFTALAVLWLIPIAAVAALNVAASHLRTVSAARSRRGLVVALLAAVAVLVHVIALVVVLGQAGEVGASSQVLSVLGAGYWLGLIGAVVAVLGGLSARDTAADAR